MCTSQFSSAVVLVLVDTHHQHDLNLVIGDHWIIRDWQHDDSNSPISTCDSILVTSTDQHLTPGQGAGECNDYEHSTLYLAIFIFACLSCIRCSTYKHAKSSWHIKESAILNYTLVPTGVSIYRDQVIKALCYSLLYVLTAQVIVDDNQLGMLLIIKIL